MPRVIYTKSALDGLSYCRKFLAVKNPQAASRSGQVISHHFGLLETSPNIGKPLEDSPELRELIIPFGDSGYISLYRYHPEEDAVYVLAFRHQKEAGYS